MRNLSKEEALLELSKIPDVIFVGGTSEYLQGFKTELNDIDISITDIEPLKYFGYLFTAFDDSFYGLSGNRSFIPLPQVLIDVFMDQKKPEYTMVKGFRCETIHSMIELRKNTLLHSREKLSEKSFSKIKVDLERLEKINYLHLKKLIS